MCYPDQSLSVAQSFIGSKRPGVGKGQGMVFANLKEKVVVSHK